MVGETREEVLVVVLEGVRLRTVDFEDSIIMAFHPDQHVDGAADIELPQERRPAEPFLDDKVARDDRHARAQRDSGGGVHEIGRASGRARGCRYVWISVVAVSLYKK